MRGTFHTTTSSSVSTLAARMGRAPFLLPAGTTVPESEAPPWSRNFSMSGRVVPAAGSGAEGPSRVATASEASTVAAMSVRVSREEAWSLLSDWVASESLRRHCLCVEAAMRAYARREGADEELWGVTGLLHDTDYERFPDMDDTVAGHPRTIIAELERQTRRRTWTTPSRRTPTSSASRATPRWSGRCTRSTSCRASSSRAPSCARPASRASPKSVKKKLKDKSFAAAVDREDVRTSAEELGLEFDEHVAFVIAAIEERAAELGLLDGTPTTA